MSTPRYSFVICNLNMADTLEQSLQSLLDQLPEKAEVVVVDGGSTDASQDILQSFSEECESFSFYVRENGSLGSDRNFGNFKASGDFVVHQFDADDRILEGMLQDALKKFEKEYRSSSTSIYVGFDGFNICSKSLISELGYSHTNRREDRELFRRLENKDGVKIVESSMKVAKEIKRDKVKDIVKKDYWNANEEFKKNLGIKNIFKEFVLDENVSVFTKCYRGVFFCAALFENCVKGYFCEKCGERITEDETYRGKKSFSCPNNCGFQFFPECLKQRYLGYPEDLRLEYSKRVQNLESVSRTKM